MYIVHCRLTNTGLKVLKSKYWELLNEVNKGTWCCNRGMGQFPHLPPFDFLFMDVSFFIKNNFSFLYGLSVTMSIYLHVSTCITVYLDKVETYFPRAAWTRAVKGLFIGSIATYGCCDRCIVVQLKGGDYIQSF